MSILNVTEDAQDSAMVYAPFDEGYESLKVNGYEIISLPESA